MAETITTYDLVKPDLALPMERDAFYAEQIKAFETTGKPTKAAGVVAVIIFNELGELLIQQRSSKKNHNAGLFDKSIGGHIQYGDTEEYTVMVETVQELQVPSITLKTDEDFQKTLKVLKEYLNTVAIVKHIDTLIWQLEKVFQVGRIPIANKLHLFFGIYSGAVKNVDREARGVLFYSLEELQKELEKSPERFSDDIHYLMTHRLADMQNFISQFQQVI